MSKRTTTRQSNPRYLISRDGVEVGYYPGFTSVEAIKRAKIHYGAGKYTAEKVDSSMYLGRGAERTQARERRERQEARHAERMEMAKRRNSGKEKTYITKNQLMEIIFSKNLDVHPYTLGKYPYKVQWKFRDGKIFAIEFPDKTVLIDTKHLLHKNGTHIHAENIDHLDVAKVHNPELDNATAQTIYHNANSTGLGFAIGDEYDDIGEAAVNAGWRVLERYDVSLLHAIDSVGNGFLVGGDGMGQGAWVIGLPYDVETEVEYET